jgi:hypothetical protein
MPGLAKQMQFTKIICQELIDAECMVAGCGVQGFSQ